MASKPPTFGKLPQGGQLPYKSTTGLLQNPSSGAQWRAASPVRSPGNPREADIVALVRSMGGAKQNVDEILGLLSTTQVDWLKRIKDGHAAADDVKFMVQFYLYLRGTTMSPTDIAMFFAKVSGNMRGAKLDDMRKLVSNTPHLDKFMAQAGKGAKALDLLLFYMECNDHAKNGRWDQVIVATYKFAMGKAIWWAGLIDGLQSLLESTLPPTAKSKTVFKVMRSVDPVGLGGAGIDAICFFVVAFSDKIQGRPFNEDRLAQLSKRLKSGPTSFFYEWGEKLPIGEALYDLLNMQASDWQRLGSKSMQDLHASLKSWVR